MNPTGTSASALAFSASEPSTAAESTTGSVFGMARMAQYPPAAAAAVPEAIVSSSSRPGVRRWTCGSTKAGASTSPAWADPGSSRVMTPFSTVTVSAASIPSAGSMTRAPSMTRLSW